MSSRKVAHSGFRSVFIALTFLSVGLWSAYGADTSGSGTSVGHPKVGFSARFAKTPVPLREMHFPPVHQSGAKHEINPVRPIPFPNATSTGRVPDKIVQGHPGTSQPAPTGVNFEGVDANGPNPCGCAPPDTNGAVGSTQYVQWVNLAYEVFDKTTGASILGPLPGNDLFSALGGACAANNSGDPEAKYDQSAHQWVLMQPVFSVVNGGYHFCFAVSQTDDATGIYNLYDFNVGSAEFPDYPHLGVWPDGYYLTDNEFNGNTFNFDGGGLYAFDRVNMLAGNPAATFNYFQVPGIGGFLPSDWDGDGGAFGLAPPAGAPNYFMTFNCTACNGTDGEVEIWQFHADYSVGGTPTLTGPAVVTTTPFALLGCVLAGNRSCVPENGGEGLDSLGDRLMYRLPYRNYGTYESVVLNFTVDDGTGVSGPRWIEIRDPGGSAGGPTDYQESTYNPGDSTWRWMGSIAEDISGNMALGYSKSDATIFPEIDVTGRLVGDPLGQMGAEVQMQAGGGAQQSTANRWGDYSAMTVDPTDGCTFYFTEEYYAATGSFAWSTRVGAFKFPSCTAGPTGTIAGAVTDSSNGNPIAGAKVTANTASTQTDGSGNYGILLPVALSPYNMTASKYGYIAGNANNVVITQNNTTTQNFSLDPAPMTTVVGTITDGSGQAWPLYSQIVITAPGAPTFTIYSDPETGGYSINLVSGSTYTFVVTSPGYVTGGGTAAVSGATQEVDFQLLADLVACNAPGYALNVTGTFSNFSNAGGTTPPPGWTVTNTTPDTGLPWSFTNAPDPCGMFPGNDTGGDGKYALVNSNCDGFVTDDTTLYSPVTDLSSLSTAAVSFNNEYIDCCGSSVNVDLSSDGGTTWNQIWFQSGASIPGPNVQTIDITPSISSTVQARWHFNGFWAWWWQVDNALVGVNNGCLPLTGGLVVGNTYDANTALALNGVTVTDAAGSTTSVATPNDPNLDDGFYVLFAPGGTQNLTASMSKYADNTQSVNVLTGGVVRQNFNLAAGFLAATPSPLFDYINPGANQDNVTLNLNNTGGADANFSISELDIPPPARPTARGPFADPAKAKAALDRIPTNSRGMKETNARTTQGIPAIASAMPTPAPLAAGNVINSYPIAPVGGGWGLGFNTQAAPNDLWVSSISVLGGDNKDHRYQTDGTLTTDTIDDSPWVGAFAADMAYDARTGMLWEVDVPNSGSSCIFELDPVALVSTGNKICPNFGTSERGLAYNPITDTFYSGSWNDGVINHFDTSGTILDSAYVGIAISGLAFNSSTGHLFVMTNHGFLGGFDVYVLDAMNGYALVGGFFVTSGGTPVMTQFGGAGMDVDCNGDLWLVDQGSQTIYQVDSGETGVCKFQDIPWLSENPTSGTVTAGTTSGVTATFDATGLTPGLRQGQLVIRTNTPYSLPTLPVDFIVRFLDVADSNAFARFIYAIAGQGITAGCGGNNYCGANNVLRNQMAVFVLRGEHGASYVPPSGTPQVYGDVPPGSFGYDFINQTNAEGIFPDCGGGNFCPTADMQRITMAYVLLLGEHGGAYVPPAANCGTFPFVDVACPSTDADFVSQLVTEGITAGCDATHYCPTNPVSRSAMAVFLTTTFRLPHFP